VAPLDGATMPTVREDVAARRHTSSRPMPPYRTASAIAASSRSFPRVCDGGGGPV